MLKMMNYTWAIALAAALLCQGCATMKKEECLTADWGQIGYEDGLEGHAPERIGKHRKACAEYGVTPDLTAYTTGRTRGLAQYCTPARGYALGSRGNLFTDICQVHPDLEKGFHEGFLAGREAFLLEEQIEKKEKLIRALKKEISRLEERIRIQEKALSPKCTDSASCRQALDQIRDLDHEVFIRKQTIREEKQAISALSRTLRDQKAASAY